MLGLNKSPLQCCKYNLVFWVFAFLSLATCNIAYNHRHLVCRLIKARKIPFVPTLYYNRYKLLPANKRWAIKSTTCWRVYTRNGEKQVIFGNGQTESLPYIYVHSVLHGRVKQQRFPNAGIILVYSRESSIRGVRHQTSSACNRKSALLSRIYAGESQWTPIDKRYLANFVYYIVERVIRTQLVRLELFTAQFFLTA
jgi:hypothetical protein